MAVTFDSNLSEVEAAVLTHRLTAYNRVHAPVPVATPEESCPLRIAMRSSEGALVGGLVGRTHAIPFWLEITVLWIDDVVRGQGLGRWLVEQAEQEARRRGCRFARVATSDYQAPHFYMKLGYAQYGLLEDCPPGETVYYLHKDL